MNNEFETIVRAVYGEFYKGLEEKDKEEAINNAVRVERKLYKEMINEYQESIINKFL